jgi:Spy/CpxP family protein refolding chaperone
VLAIAAQVEQGKIDRAALQPKIDAAVSAFAQSSPADHAALEQLHAILDPEQRAELVDALQARMHDHGGRREHMQEMARLLNLTDDQKSQIRDAFKEHFAAMRKAHEGSGEHAHGKQMLDAFKSDHFVVSELAPGSADPRAHASEMGEHMLGVVETVLPILTPEQRTIAAQKLREHVNGGGGDDFEL